MPGVGERKGFEELSPNKTANELMRHLNPGDKVAIISRFATRVKPYVGALEKRGIVVRVVAGQSGVEDFCFLKSAQKELIGTLKSTYALWAAYLGNTKRAILYQVVSPYTRDKIVRSDYEWKHPNMKDRITYPIYKSEKQDALEASA